MKTKYIKLFENWMEDEDNVETNPYPEASPVDTDEVISPEGEEVITPEAPVATSEAPNAGPEGETMHTVEGENEFADLVNSVVSSGASKEEATATIKSALDQNPELKQSYKAMISLKAFSDKYLSQPGAGLGM